MHPLPHDVSFMNPSAASPAPCFIFAQVLCFTHP